MRIARALTAAAVAGGLFAATSGVAAAGHGHYVVREDRNGETHCRYVAHGQTSKEADEPGGHKFHDNVHNGTPGSDERGNDVDKESNESERCDHVSGKR